MTNSILLYLIQNEKEIPTQLVPNTAYYIIGKEVRIIDNMGQMSVFKMAGTHEDGELSTRIDECEKKINDCDTRLEYIYKYFRGFGVNEQ